MKVGFVFTNYNNSAYTRNAVDSIMKISANVSCFIVIVDNNSEDEDILNLDKINFEYPDVKIIYNRENLGYFKGLNIGIKYLQESTIGLDFMVVGNNDLVFPANFMSCLQARQDLFSKFPVVSPDLITLDGVHQNPHVISRINPFRELIWDIYYSNYLVALIINKIAKISRSVTERRDYLDHETPQLIYQGYGACYILGPVFFNEFSELWAPTFLMGEELFLTKQLEEKGYNVYYEPSIKVEHHDHATIGKVHSRQLWKIASDSHKVYRRHVGWFSSKLKILTVPNSAKNGK